MRISSFFVCESVESGHDGSVARAPTNVPVETLLNLFERQRPRLWSSRLITKQRVPSQPLFRPSGDTDKGIKEKALHGTKQKTVGGNTHCHDVSWSAVTAL